MVYCSPLSPICARGDGTRGFPEPPGAVARVAAERVTPMAGYIGQFAPPSKAVRAFDRWMLNKLLRAPGNNAGRSPVGLAPEILQAPFRSVEQLCVAAHINAQAFWRGSPHCVGRQPTPFPRRS